MLFHMSIAAQDPRHVAQVVAELWNGEAMPFPPVTDSAWIAFAGDDRGTALEVYPADAVLREAEGDADAYGERTGRVAFSPSHGAIATHMTADAVLAIAARESWPAKYRKRGGLFGVIEVWIEGRQMMEVLTPGMQEEYRASMTIDTWRRMLAAGPA